MKRTTFDATRDQQVADEFLANHAPCAFCGVSTERQTLTLYGARCGTCFNAYVTNGRPAPPMPSVQERMARLQRLKTVIAGAAAKRMHAGLAEEGDWQ